VSENQPAGRRFERAGRKMDDAVGSAAERVQKELADAITYLNNEVVPKVRSGSTQALRTAADKLAKLADYMEKQKNK
jgi:hypothetical protein